MNANKELTDKLSNKELSLEEKLAAIDAAVQKAQEESDKTRKKMGLPSVPIDPSDATQCLGCQ